MTTESNDNFPKEAEISAWIITKWDTLIPAQQSITTAVLTTWIDQIRKVGMQFFAEMNAAPTAQAQNAALKKYSDELTDAANSSRLDLLALYGIHCPPNDPRRLEFFTIAQLNNPDQTKQ